MVFQGHSSRYKLLHKTEHEGARMTLWTPGKLVEESMMMFSEGKGMQQIGLRREGAQQQEEE